MSNQIPTVGRIVNAVIKSKLGELVTRPAIVVRPWGSTPNAALNAQVFCDGDGGIANDGLPNVVWKTSLTFDPTGAKESSWHWPARV